MDIQTALDILKEQQDHELLKECQYLLNQFKENILTLETRSFLSGKYDPSDCLVSIFAGAGGTDAQDWTQMLLRMYIRWVEKKEFSSSILDQTIGDEAGIKSVTIMVKGEFAYGLLKHEHGIHRLVRLSPFNANDKRQTSFAAVDVIPHLDPQFDLKIDTKDLRIDTFRASGAGGQHINKTDSAVRITHLPSGTVATSQQSRSQIENKELAMGILKSRLVRLMEEQHLEQVSQLRGSQKENAWGNQIRSYVFHPYKLVKDLRTNVETSQLNEVMDGDIDMFIQSSLRQL